MKYKRRSTGEEKVQKIAAGEEGNYRMEIRECAVAKSTPGAMGDRETRSGEFCRGNDVVHQLFFT